MINAIHVQLPNAYLWILPTPYALLGQCSGQSFVKVLQVQSQYEAVVNRFNQEQREVEELLQARDQAYLDLLASGDGQARQPLLHAPPRSGEHQSFGCLNHVA